MISRYLISSPGRSGSHIVAAMIQSADLPIIHTHYPLFPTDDDTKTGLIIVQRRDLFATIMSNIIVNHTGQTTEYTKTDFEPFTVTYEQFATQYNWHRWYYDNHDFSRPWGLIKTLYFEDFINNYNFVLQELNLVKKPKLILELGNPELVEQFNPNFTVKAPYNYRQLIINHEECREFLNQLNSTSQFTRFNATQFGYVTDEYLSQPWDSNPVNI